ncbi:MAG: D-alanyl-D-alanine carboxypeptidase [Candidatus Yonathbacteria bacterium]|nr:D-alanyl-D-alanine carboxypeptidase [Candidatus Yonathbacteria bacterium]
MKAMENNQPNNSTKESVYENEKFAVQNREGNKEHDSFSEALLGKHPTEPEILAQGDFLDSAYPENVLASIATVHPAEKPIALLEEKPSLLLSEHIKQKQKSSLPALILLATVFFSYLIGYGSYYISDTEGDTAQKTAIGSNNPFSNISLEARSAYVYDIYSKKVLFALNENSVLPLASLTKLMTAVIASELLPSGTVVTIGKTDIENEGDSGLYMNEHWNLSDIIGFTLMTSSNDGASALAATAGSLGQNAYGESAGESKRKFVDAMNKKAEALGLRGTHFYNESGLDINKEISGGYGTAHDVAILMTHIVEIARKNIESTTLARTTVTSLDNIRHQATNTNEEINAIPGILASKTGYTDLAGGNLAIAFDAGLSRPVVVVVLGSTREGRFKDAEVLTWAALKALNL